MRPSALDLKGSEQAIDPALSTQPLANTNTAGVAIARFADRASLFAYVGFQGAPFLPLVVGDFQGRCPQGVNSVVVGDFHGRCPQGVNSVAQLVLRLAQQTRVILVRQKLRDSFPLLVKTA